jgi:glucokinase
VTEIVAADIGGTNARFARATIDAAGVPTLGAVRKYKVADYPSLAACWQRFAADEGRALPDRASIAFAAPILQDTIKLTNSSWIVRPMPIYPCSSGGTRLFPAMAALPCWGRAPASASR